MRVVIAGGGIAGMAVATALGQAGHDVTVLEQASELGEIGAGLQLGPNATRVLAHWGVELPGAFAPRQAVLRDGRTGIMLYRAALGDRAMARWGAPYLHVHRVDLLGALTRAAQAAGAEIRLGARVTGFANRAQGVEVALADAPPILADLAVGADGIHSRVAAQMGAGTARFTGQIAWRAVVPAPSPMPPDATVWAGPGRHLVCYYLRGGTVLNIVAVEERAEWTAETWATLGDAGRLRAAFAGWHGSVTDTLARVTQAHVWGLFDRPPRAHWIDGRVVLLGDAVHPMLPFLAQGAAMGIEDAAALARHLTPAGARIEALARALGAFQAERRPRTRRVQAQAAAMGRLFHRRTLLGRLIHHGPPALVSRLAPGLAAGRLDWLYGHNALEGA